MKQLLRLTALTLVLSMAVLLSVSCTDSEKEVYRIGNISVTEGMYNYLYACSKYMYRVNYTGGGNGFSDTKEGWETKTADKTHTERFAEYFDYRLKTRLVAAYLYENSQNKQSSGDIRATLNYIIKDTFSILGAENTEDYNTHLSEYGADYEDMFRALLYEYEYMLLFSQLYGSQGIGVLADPYKEEVDAFYRDSYTHIRYLVIESDDPDAAAKRLAAEAAVTDAAFNDVLTAYAAKDENTDAFLYKINTEEVDSVLFDAAHATEIGQTKSVTLKNGKTCVLRRYALQSEYREDAYATYFDGFTTLAASYVYADLLESYFDEIAVLESISYLPYEKETCGYDKNVIYALTK